MQDDLKTCCTQQSRSTPRAFHVMPALIHLKNMVIQALGAHLYLCHTEVTEPAQFIWGNFIGPRLDHKPHVAVMSCFVDGMSFLECPGFYLLFFYKGRGARGWGVHRIEAALDKPCLIITSIRRPRPAKDQQLDLVGWMSQRFELFHPGVHLCIGVELM